MNPNSNIFNILQRIDEFYAMYPEECVDRALDILIGRIETCAYFIYLPFNQLKELSKHNPDVYAIQIGPDMYAIPNFIKKNNGKLECYGMTFMRSVKGPNGVWRESDAIDYKFVNDLHGDLNKLFMVYDMPITFKGIKKVEKGRFTSPGNFYCKLRNKKLDVDALERMIQRLVNYFYDEHPDPELDKMLDEFDKYDEWSDSMTFSEYIEYIRRMTGFDLLHPPGMN